MNRLEEIERLITENGWTIEPDLSPEANAKLPSYVTVNGEALRVPLEIKAQLTLEYWLKKQRGELIELLAPYGVHPDEIFAVNWERIVRPNEV